MRIIIGKTAGFCFGVENAVTKAEEEAKKNKQISCLGELVHNTQVTDELAKKGIKFIDNIEQANKRVIIRSHGVEKQIYDKAKQLGIELVDLTCPKVLHIHKLAQEYSKKGYYIFLIGKKKHPEMIGTVSFCGDYYYVIEDESYINQAIEEFRKTNKEKLLIIAQTTYSLEKFEEIVDPWFRSLGSHASCKKTSLSQPHTGQVYATLPSGIVRMPQTAHAVSGNPVAASKSGSCSVSCGHCAVKSGRS